MQDILDQINGQEFAWAASLSGLSLAEAESEAFIQPGGALRDLLADEQFVLFQKRTALFLRRSFPAYTANFSVNELENLAVTLQKQAGLKGFATEKQIWHYSIAVIYCGFFFEQDIQYADMLNVIGWHEKSGNIMLLLDKLLDIIDEYALECEKDFTAFGKKLHYIATFYADPRLSDKVLENLPAAEKLALGEKILAAVFPVRAALWTPENRHKFITMSLDYARNLGFSVKDSLIYLLANVYFGCAFEHSPFYPWAHFLQDRAIPAPERSRHFIALAQKHLAQLAKA